MKIGIATTTRYAQMDDLRAQLALGMIRTAQTLDISVVTADESTANVFRTCALRLGATVCFPRGEEVTMGAGRRLAIEEASKLVGSDGVVVWMEPEKEPLVEFLPVLCAPIRNGAADIVVPARTAEGFQSYPLIQALAEQLGNAVFRHLTGLELDVWFGPRILSSKAIPYFLHYEGTYGDRWDSIFVPLLRAKSAGLRLVGSAVEYRHPKEQTAQEQHDTGVGILKRIDQLHSLVTALCLETATPAQL